MQAPAREKPKSYTGMSTNTPPKSDLTLGRFLRERRAYLSPSPDRAARRRTPGLRREEVASRAGVSVTWYTWLEQERGGPASNAVLESLARALELDPAGREVLFLLAHKRQPPARLQPEPEVSQTLQRVLDGMLTSPAIVKTATWSIVAWNAAATAVLADYERLTFGERNVMRRLFLDPGARAGLPDWEDNARFAIAVFRIDVARTGGGEAADSLVAELLAASADFRRLWAETGMRSHGVGLKRFDHPSAGRLSLEYAAFPVDGAEGLTMIVFTPASPQDARAITALLS